jgi:nitrogen regulatory protein PII
LQYKFWIQIAALGAKVKIVKACVKINRAAHVMRALRKAKLPALTAYAVHGTNCENPPASHELHPLTQTNMPESVKIEVICDDRLSDRVAQTIAQAAKTGSPDDVAVGVEPLEIPHIRNVMVLHFGFAQNT